MHRILLNHLFKFTTHYHGKGEVNNLYMHDNYLLQEIYLKAKNSLLILVTPFLTGKFSVDKRTNSLSIPNPTWLNVLIEKNILVTQRLVWHILTKSKIFIDNKAKSIYCNLQQHIFVCVFFLADGNIRNNIIINIFWYQKKSFGKLYPKSWSPISHSKKISLERFYWKSWMVFKQNWHFNEY